MDSGKRVGFPHKDEAIPDRGKQMSKIGGLRKEPRAASGNRERDAMANCTSDGRKNREKSGKIGISQTERGF